MISFLSLQKFPANAVRPWLFRYFNSALRKRNCLVNWLMLVFEYKSPILLLTHCFGAEGYVSADPNFASTDNLHV